MMLLSGLKLFLIELITSIVIKVLRQRKPEMVQGDSDGNTERKLKDKIRKDGWP
jgi:hypothetical protein